MQANRIIDGIQSGGNAIKDSAVWLGKQVKLGFQKAPPAIRDVARNALKFLRTPAGLGTIGLGVATMLLMASNSNSLSEKGHRATRYALKGVAAIIYVATGVLFGVALATGNPTLV